MMVQIFEKKPYFKSCEHCCVKKDIFQTLVPVLLFSHPGSDFSSRLPVCEIVLQMKYTHFINENLKYNFHSMKLCNSCHALIFPDSFLF